MSALLTKSSWCGVAPVLTLQKLLGIRRKQPLLELASTQHLALSKGDIPEVGAGGTGTQALEADQLAVIDERPFLHASPQISQVHTY